LAAAAVAAVALSPLAGACNGDDGGDAQAGTGGGCPSGALPLFTVRIRTEREVALPADTTLEVRWTAAEEPKFVLGDKSTWKTLEEANVVCNVDANAPVPTDLRELVCDLWTTGATEINVHATGYLAKEETLTPKKREGCEKPVPSDVDVTLTADMGMGGSP
jgi:hypothetical protein